MAMFEQQCKGVEKQCEEWIRQAKARESKTKKVVELQRISLDKNRAEMAWTNVDW